jgi:multicomponent Na+:H+ antiporter subunit A
VLGAGLVLATATALVPVALGHAVLEHASATVDLPVSGSAKLTSTLAFDAGVYLVVVGLVLMVFEAFGDEVERPAAVEREGRRR